MKRRTRIAHKLRTLPLAVSLLVSLVVSASAPFVQTVSAASPSPPGTPTNINLIQRTNPANPVDFYNDTNLTVGTCVGSFQTPPPTKSGSLLAAQFGPVGSPSLNSLIGEDPSQLNNTDVNSYIGDFISPNDQGYGGPGDLSLQQLQFLMNGVNTSNVPAISFAPTKGSGSSTPPPVINGDYKASNDFCKNLIMLPVSQTEWRGFNVSAAGIENDGSNGGTPISSDPGSSTYLDFKLTSTSQGQTFGTLSYATYDGHNRCSGNNNDLRSGPSVSCHIGTGSNTIDIGGTPDFTGGSGGGGTGTAGSVVNVTWINASQVTINSGPYSGEVYTKPNWNDTHTTPYAGESDYFLSSVPSAEQSARGGLTLGSAPLCEDAPQEAACADGTSNCVPFLTSQVPINLTGGPDSNGVTTLDNNIHRIGGSTPTTVGITPVKTSSMLYYDYDTTCKQTTISPVQSSDPGAASTIWLFYSSKSDAFETIFSTGDGNEQRYIGTYNKNAQGAYVGGQNGCDGIISGNIPKGVKEQQTFPVTWSLYDNKCNNNTRFGDLHVQAIADEAGFEGASAAVPQTNANTTPPQLCESLGDFGVSFIVCPIIDGAEGLVALLDNAINSLLTINTDQIFGNCPNGQTTCTAAAYHKAWAAFRTFALSLIAIAALVMVIAQAAGLELLDAYMWRKILPKLLIASIGITLSWPLLKFFITLSNDAGNGIRNIIYAPFSSLHVPAGTSLGGGSSTVLILVGSGGLLAFGWLGLLSFLLSALLAALIGFGIMAFRIILVVFLVMMAPLAIACYILPNTHKGWVIWRDAFVGVMLAFAIISAMIATGRVFSLTSFAVGGTFNQIIGVICYFLPYFLITKAFSWAGGAIATVGGFVNDRSRGAFDRLKKFRAQQPGKRWSKAKEGELWNGSRRGPLGAVARFGNTLGEHAGMGVRGNFGLGSAGEAAMATREGARIAQTLRDNPALAELAKNDDANAVLAFSGGTRGGAGEAARELFIDRNGNYDEVRGQRAIDAASYFLRSDGRKNAAAALQTVSHNKSRAVGAGRTDIVQRGINRLAGGNVANRRNLSYMYEWESRANGGRADLGGDWMSERVQTAARNAQLVAAANGATAAQQGQVYQQTVSDLTMMDGVGRTEVPTLVRGHTNQVKQLVGDVNEQGTLERMLKSGNAEDRMQAATTVLELQRSLAYANKDSAELINKFFYRNGINQQGGQMEGQLVDLVNSAPLTSVAGHGTTVFTQTPGAPPGVGTTTHTRQFSTADLQARARVYDQPTSQGVNSPNNP